MKLENNPENIIMQASDLYSKMTNRFPLHIFPPGLQSIIQEVCDSMEYSIDYLSVAMLTAVAVGIGNTHRAKFKNEWEEVLVLYVAITGRSGTKKTHPLKFALQPLFEYDRLQMQEFMKAHSQYEEMMRMTKPDRIEAGYEEYPQQPVRKRLIVSDITPETLGTIHMQNPRGLCLYYDELAGWINNFNRYNNGSEEEFWLSAFNGNPFISDRREIKNSVYISQPFICVIGTLQNKIMQEFAKNNRSYNGFIDRILFVYPQSQEMAGINMKELDACYIKAWSDLMQKFISLDYSRDIRGNTSAHSVPFSTDAKEHLVHWYNSKVKDPSNPLTEEERQIYPKLLSYTIRFSLLLQMIRWAYGEVGKEKIDIVSVQRAIMLEEYFLKMALRVRKEIREASLTELQLAVYSSLPDQFTTNQGVEIAESIGMKKRTFYEFLKKNIKILFLHEKHSHYTKI